MEAHLNKVFDHSISNLSTEPVFDASEALADGDMAKTLIAILQSPHGMKQALVLREIIDRPTHRWE